jgi:transcription initiation factor TFIIIB Brf1 subunit/transcription initiation factor TFIIB
METCDVCNTVTGFPTLIKDQYHCMTCDVDFMVKSKPASKSNCFSCNSHLIITDKQQGFTICKKCGIVQSGIISEDQEWNNYTAGVDNSRVGLVDETNPFSVPGSTINPVGNKHFIKYVNKDGKICHMDLYKKMISVNYTSKQKAHDCVAKVINQTKIGDNIKRRAVALWAEMLKSSHYETHRNSVRRGIIFCCIYYSALSLNLSMTREEIADQTGIKSEDMNKGDPIFRELISKTKFGYIIKIESEISNMFERFMDSFDFDNKTKFKYSKLCKKLSEDYREFFENRKENTLVSGIMAFVFENYASKKHKKIKISDIHEATHVSVPTINTLVKELKDIVDVKYYKI